MEEKDNEGFGSIQEEIDANLCEFCGRSIKGEGERSACLECGIGICTKCSQDGLCDECASNLT